VPIPVFFAAVFQGFSLLLAGWESLFSEVLLPNRLEPNIRL
jgi:hypothetical protein